MATLDELVVRIKADASQLDRELRRVGATTQQATGQMAGGFAAVTRSIPLLAAALAALNIVGFTRNAIAAADALNDLSDRTGVSARFLSAMKIEIENAGGTIEQFGQSLFFMNRQIGEAIKDAEGPAAQAFQQLGLSIRGMVNNSPEENFRLIAEAISQLPTEFERAEAAAALFGRGVAGLQPIIRGGADAIDEITEKADEFGRSLSEGQLQAIDDFGDGFNTLAETLKNVVAGTFADVVIAVQNIIATVEDAVDKVRLLKAGGLDALNYIEKARAGGFATTIERGEVISSQPYGPNRPRQGTTGGSARGSAERKQAEREIKELSKATEDFGAEMKRVEDQGIVTARVLKDSFSDALESAVFDFENFGDAARGVLDGLARDIARRGFIEPLSQGIGDMIFGGGGGGGGFLSAKTGMGGGGGFGSIFSSIGSFLGFADGGRPPVGRPSWVGEEGPELFIPDSAGTVVPNGASMGSSITVVNTWNIQSGVSKQELAALIPTIEQRATAGTLAAIEKGGRAAQVVGKRS